MKAENKLYLENMSILGDRDWKNKLLETAIELETELEKYIIKKKDFIADIREFVYMDKREK